MHLTCVQQSCHSYPLAFCGITVLWGIMRKAFSTVIPFSCLQACPEGGQSSHLGASRASLLWSPLVPWWTPSCSRAAGLWLLPQEERSVLQMFWRPQFLTNLGMSVSHAHITFLHAEPWTTSEQPAVNGKGMRESVLQESSEPFLASCLMPGWGAFPPFSSQGWCQEGTGDCGLMSLSAYTHHVFQSK